MLSDRYYRGPTGRGFITGNPDLEPETSVQGDVALRYVAPRFRLATFYYEYRIDDLIERYSTSTDNFFFRNRGTARIRGFEVEGQAELGAGVTLELASQVAEGRALDDDAYLDDISPANLSAVLRKQFGERGFGQVRVAYFSDDEHFGPTERAVPGLHPARRRRAAFASPSRSSYASRRATCSTRSTTPARTCAPCSRPAARRRSSSR